MRISCCGCGNSIMSSVGASIRWIVIRYHVIGVQMHHSDHRLYFPLDAISMIGHANTNAHKWLSILHCVYGCTFLAQQDMWNLEYWSGLDLIRDSLDCTPIMFATFESVNCENWDLAEKLSTIFFYGRLTHQILCIVHVNMIVHSKIFIDYVCKHGC